MELVSVSGGFTVGGKIPIKSLLPSPWLSKWQVRIVARFGGVPPDITRRVLEGKAEDRIDRLGVWAGQWLLLMIIIAVPGSVTLAAFDTGSHHTLSVTVGISAVVDVGCAMLAGTCFILAIYSDSPRIGRWAIIGLLWGFTVIGMVALMNDFLSTSSK